MGFLSKILSSKKDMALQKQERDPVRYEAEREKARSKSSKDRLSLARNPKTHQEILYYLATDEDKGVRQAIAKNPSTPMQVSEALAKDDDTEVKIALIKRLTALLPDLSQDQYAHLYAFAAQALGIMALDEVLRVRLALSTALKDELFAPPDVASQLAKDLEREVSEPILKLCSAVPDDVLIDILNHHPAEWVITAIASRQDISQGVSQAVVDTENTSAGAVLIGNETADIPEEAIDEILRLAPEKPEWHKPLALQSHLPGRVIREIIKFVDSSIQKLIFERTDLEDEVRNELMDTVSRRMSFLVDDQGKKITPIEKVKLLSKRGELDDDAVKDALALREHEFVYAALSLQSGIKMSIVKKMIDTGSAKAAVSIAWKAGFKMRTALEIQKTIAKIQPRELIYPKNGDQYSLPESDMQWQVDFFSE
jgi:uncharacterized protein (DUF2336 family)